MTRVWSAVILGLLLLLAEILSMDFEIASRSAKDESLVLVRLSAGFPFRCIEYRKPDWDTSYTGSASKNGEPDPVVRVEGPLLACDALALALVAVLFGAVSMPAARAALATEAMIGVVAGTMVFALGVSPMLSQSWLPIAIGIVLLFVVIPLSICALSERHKHRNVFLVVLSCAGGWGFLRAGFIAMVALDGGSMFLEPPEQLRFWLCFAGLPIVLAVACFAMGLFRRRVLRRPFQWSCVAPPPEAAEPRSEGDDVSPPKRERSPRRWIVVGATVLLAVTLYVGEHFSVVRDLRKDALSTDIGRTEMAILAKLETLTQPLVGRVRAQITETVSSSFRGGIDARYQRALLVNGEDLYYASFEKHLLIPWVQVEVVRMGTVADVQQRAMRHKRALSHEPSPARTEGPSTTERK
jgi:hypothetical protein